MHIERTVIRNDTIFFTWCRFIWICISVLLDFIAFFLHQLSSTLLSLQYITLLTVQVFLYKFSFFSALYMFHIVARVKYPRTHYRCVTSFRRLNFPHFSHNFWKQCFEFLKCFDGITKVAVRQVF